TVRSQLGAVGREQHVADGDDHAALGLLRVQLDQDRLQAGRALGELGGLLLGGGGLRLGIQRLLLRNRDLGVGVGGIAPGAVGLGGAGFQLHAVALAAGVGDV